MNSIIGMTNFRPIIIRQDMIRARMVGYKTMAHYEAAVKAGGKRNPPRELLTTSKIKTTLETLEKKGFFLRAVGGRRTTFFATAKKADGTPRTRDELRQLVCALITKRNSLREERLKDRQAIATQSPLKKETDEKGAKEPPFLSGDHSITTQSPNGSQNVATEPPLDSHSATTKRSAVQNERCRSASYKCSPKEPSKLIFGA